MRPSLGISIELFVLALVFAVSPFVPRGYPFAFYALVAEFAATYLIHCPAHYIVGTIVGLRFKAMRLGKTTLTKALPPAFKPIGRLFPILTLSLDHASVPKVSQPLVRAMYASGTVASSGSAVVVALGVSLSGQTLAAILCWLLAAGYLLFDIIFSPKSGDLMRARKSWT